MTIGSKTYNLVLLICQFLNLHFHFSQLRNRKKNSQEKFSGKKSQSNLFQAYHENPYERSLNSHMLLGHLKSDYLHGVKISQYSYSRHVTFTLPPLVNSGEQAIYNLIQIQFQLQFFQIFFILIGIENVEN